MERCEIAIVGAGLGGLVAGLMLLQQGHDVHIYEQAQAFSRLGAGIQLGPNVLKIMRRIGLERQVEAMGSKPEFWISRDGRDASVLAKIPLNYRRAEYGAAYVTIHRADFHRLLVDNFPIERLHYDRRLVNIAHRDNGVTLVFADAPQVRADFVVGADGIDSMVREILLGVERPLDTGYVGHRAIFPATKLRESGLDFDPCAKWWSQDRHLMAYYLDDQQQEMYYVTGVPEPGWTAGTSSVPSSRDEMRAAFADYHPTVHAMIDASGEITKWPLLTRPPLALWSKGRAVLLGDACHPMKPHMAQGAAMAIEDAAVLSRCLAECGAANLPATFALYETNRRERASRVQSVSNANTWLKTDENPEWVYGHDVFAAPLLSSVF